MHQTTWREMKMAYKRYCDLNNFHPSIYPVPAFLAFIGIDYGWAAQVAHEDCNHLLLNKEKAVARINALCSVNYVALFNAMKAIDDDKSNRLTNE